MDAIAYVKLLAYKEELGDYVIYVFKNLGEHDMYNEYIMCTKFPRWQTEPLSIGEVGFLKYKIIVAGSDSWYDRENQEMISYKYSNIQFLEFVKEATESEKCCMK